MTRLPRSSSSLVVPALWIGVVLATQAWPSWSRGIREQFAGDVQSYEQIARAAPGLPAGPLPEQHAERFPVHWLIGALADRSGTDLHTVYRAASLALLLALVAVLALTLRRLHLDPFAQAVVVGLVVASAYPFRYLLAAPGMAADALFLVGLALVVEAFGGRGATLPLLLLGLVLATLGRQTAIPVALVAAALLVAGSRPRAGVLVVVVPILVYVTLRLVAGPFSGGGAVGGASSVASAFGHPHELASHLGRMGLALAVPVAIIAGASLRTRVLPAVVPLALAAAVVVQPLVLNPDWVVGNEPRLTALALPALAVAAAAPLYAARLRASETALICAAILLGSFHASYSNVGIAHAWVWAGLVVGAAALAFAVLVRPRLIVVRTRPTIAA